MMTGKQLKNAILQLAIQGKLVPQDANDEPASVLLARIRKEKEQLVKAGKLKKKDLETTPIADEEKPFEIPESWEWIRLGEIVINRDSERIPLSVSVRQQQCNRIYDYYGPGGAFDKVNDYLFDKRLLLIGEDGANLLTRTKPNAFFAEGKYWVNNHVHVLDSYIEDGIILDYIAMRINGMSLADYVTGTAQPKMNQEKLNSIPIPLPPLTEQHRIVSKIEELMPLVEEYGVAQEKLNHLNEALPEALKKSILQQAIQGKLVPQDANDEPASALLARIRKEKEQLVKAGKLKKKDLATTPIIDEEKPFEIPESWEWVRLGEIFSHNNGKQLNRADTKGELHDYITTSNLYWDSFDLKEVRQMLFTDEELVRCTATKGDLLVCEGGDVGRSAIWDKDFDICIQNHIHRLRAYCQLCTRYFLYLLMFNKSTGLIGGKGIGIQGLSAKALHNILVALPPLAEQHRIVSRVEELMELVEGMEGGEK